MSIAYSSSSSNATNFSPSTPSLAAKLRRLKIEESVLIQSLNKNASAFSKSEVEVKQTNYLTFSEFTEFFAKVKKSFNELKQLFQDLKASTSSKEMIQCLDIDEMKKCTHELESNMKSYKLYLQTEINDLKSAEQLLNQKLNDTVTRSYFKRKPKIQTTKYTEIVPSPVKTLMSSPFKSVEVQEFQDFLKNSKNRYGGWDEYHHNIFVNMWQKYFDAENLTDKEEDVENSVDLNLFLHELTPKLLGVSQDEVASHMKWYTKYLHLKDRQQKAIDKWRSNRRMMKPSNVKKENEKNQIVKKRRVKKAKRVNFNPNNVMDFLNPQDGYQSMDKTCRFTRKCFSEETESVHSNSLEDFEEDDKRTLQFLKSTKQWKIRSSSKDIMSVSKFNNIDNIKKLGTPLWRVGL